MTGSVASIQSRKVMRMPRSLRAASAIAFGGDPTGVAMPPTFAATGMHRANPVRPTPLGRAMRTGRRTANIVAVVAVFDMNIDSDAVMIISPSTVRRALVPKGRSSTAARLRSSPYFAAASAMRKPPRNRMMTGLARLA